LASLLSELTSAKAKTFHKDKLGTITILTLKNYPEFKVLVVLDLIARNL